MTVVPPTTEEQRTTDESGHRGVVSTHWMAIPIAGERVETSSSIPDG